MSDESPQLWRELFDLNVVVVGRSLAVELLSRLLSDQGAHVVAVMSSRNGELRSNVEGLDQAEVIDFAQRSGIERFGELIVGANVLIDSSVDGALAEVGFDLEHLLALQPALLYCALRPYPESVTPVSGGEEWALAATLGFHRLDRKGPPQLLPIPLASGYGALYGAVHIAAALLEQARGVESMRLDLSVFGAALMALTGSLTELNDPQITEAKGPFRSAGDLRYRCADNRSIQITSNVPSVVLALFHAIDRPEWLAEAMMDLTSESSSRSEETWRERLSGVFQQRPAQEWESLISQAGGACAVCRTSAEWLAEPHARDTEIIVASDNANFSSASRAGAALRIYSTSRPAGEPIAPMIAPTPVSEAVSSPGSPARPAMPLAGKKVVEFSVILAGPSAGRVLGELGAEVIKFDAPDRAIPPFIGQKGWLDVNRTKRSVLIDLRTPAGRDAAWRLVEDADIVLQSYRTDKVAQLGFGPDEVMARNPRLVYVSLNAYDFGGTFSGRPGWEPLAQAVTGIHLEPGSDGVPPRIPLPMNDFGSGLICAYGAILGLRTVERTGHGVHVKASLSRTATFFSQTEFGREIEEPPHYLLGRDVRFMRCRETWLTVSAVEGVIDEVLRTDPELLHRIGDLEANDAMTVLDGFGIETAVAVAPSELSGLSWLQAAGLVGSWDHPHWGAVVHAFPESTATGIVHRRGWPASDPGEDTVDVLTEVGYSAQEIEQMINDGAARGRVPLFST